METNYVRGCNCYNVLLRIPVGGVLLRLHPYIDTGATNTTISLNMLINGSPSNGLIQRLDERAQKSGVKPRPLHGGTVERNKEDAYTYAACFKNVIVGGHFMEKFYVNIMIHGADDIFVIGNDFLNACNYWHRAGEKQLVVENPNAQKYNGSLEQLHILDSEQLSTLLFGLESEEEVAASGEDAVYAELLRKGDEIMKEL